MAARRKAARGEGEQANYLKEKIVDTQKLVEALKLGITDITLKLEAQVPFPPIIPTANWSAQLFALDLIRCAR